jgi:anti-anti-sigma regulatory factor
MLRISQSPAIQLTTINLEGKLLAAWVEEVRSAVATAQMLGAVRVNLEALTFADHAGIDLLRDLSKQQVQRVGGSAFIEGLIAMPDRVA